MSLCQPSRVEPQAKDPLEAIVQAYLDHNAETEDRYLQYYRFQKTLTAAVTKSALAELPGGGRFSHQRKIPPSVLSEAKDALLKADFTTIRSFDELHGLVRRTIGRISGIGPLTVYDTTHRIGAFLKLRPEFVYLHAGVCSGAKALGLDYRADKLPMSALPKAFQRLLPEQAEDCLCIYKDELKRLRHT
jgi:hypothetical protein